MAFLWRAVLSWRIKFLLEAKDLSAPLRIDMKTGGFEDINLLCSLSSVFPLIFDRIKAFIVRQVNFINYDIVAYRAVAERLLCEQRPLLGNVRNTSAQQ
jgi:hypothetical protein